MKRIVGESDIQQVVELYRRREEAVS